MTAQWCVESGKPEKDERRGHGKLLVLKGEELGPRASLLGQHTQIVKGIQSEKSG